MPDERKVVMKIDAIYAESGQIVLNGSIFKVGPSIKLQYYKPGFFEECTIKGDTVTFMKKVDPPAGEFHTADTYTSQPGAEAKPSDKKKGTYNPASQIWCNAVHASTALQQIKTEGMSLSDIQTLDLAGMLIADAKAIFKAGMDAAQ